MRLNRKKIIEALEIARQGYSSAISYALTRNDISMANSFAAHHFQLNKIIVELGGESVENTVIDLYMKMGKQK